MKLIGFRPADNDHESFHLWFRTEKGTISRCFVGNKGNLKTTLFIGKDEAENFGLEFSPAYIDGMLKQRYKDKK